VKVGDPEGGEMNGGGTERGRNRGGKVGKRPREKGGGKNGQDM
jgi:hypothetical protein